MTVLEKKRKNMKHLSEMNDYDFCQFISMTTNDPIELSWKLDGFFLRFGKDVDGTPWFQTARSSVLTDPMAIIWHSLEKGYDHNGMSRAECYFHLVKKLWASGIMDMLPDDSGLECEVFDKSLSSVDKESGTRTFVNIPYYDAYFDKDITLAIYRMIEASSGATWVNGYRQEFPLNLDPDIRTVGTRFEIDVDLTYFRKAVYSLNGEPLRSLTSLKHADRALKIKTKEIVATIKGQFYQYILNKAKEFNKMGDNFEGVVITVNNTEYKIVTDYFRELLFFKGMLGG